MGKKLAGNILFIVLFLVVYNTYADTTNNWEVNSKIDYSFEPTPRVMAQNIANYRNFSNSSRNWLLIKIEYYITPGDQENKKRIINDLTLNIKAIISANSESYVLSGNLSYWKILINKQKKYALALVPPQVFKFIVPKNYNFNNKIAIKVDFKVNNKTVGKALYPPQSETEKAFTNIKDLPAESVFEDIILRRDETPWQILNYDKYELLKK